MLMNTPLVLHDLFLVQSTPENGFFSTVSHTLTSLMEISEEPVCKVSEVQDCKVNDKVWFTKMTSLHLIFSRNRQFSVRLLRQVRPG